MLPVAQQKTGLAPPPEAETQDVDIVGEPSPAADLFDAQAAVDPSAGTQVTATRPVHSSSSAVSHSLHRVCQSEAWSSHGRPAEPLL